MKVIAKKHLGQNFLTNKGIVKKISDSQEIKNTSVIEVGPGYGALTEEIVKKQPKNLELIEFDPDMISLLKEKKDSGFFWEIPTKITHQDVLQWNSWDTQEEYVLFGNIPYYITSPILSHFLYTVEKSPTHMIILIQKEVGQKILDPKKTSVLQLMASLACKKIEKITLVSRGSFTPTPRVDSIVLRFEVDEKKDKKNSKEILKLIHLGFSQKRKKLINNLSSQYNEEDIRDFFQKKNISEMVRAEDLSMEIWEEFYFFLKK